MKKFIFTIVFSVALTLMSLLVNTYKKMDIQNKKQFIAQERALVENAKKAMISK